MLAKLFFFFWFCALFRLLLISAQILDGKKDVGARENVHKFKRLDNRHFINTNLESSIYKLTQSITLLNDRMITLEENIQSRFQMFGDSISEGKISLEDISTRLEVLDDLSTKVQELDLKVKDETAVIRNALTSTNRDRLSTQLEEIDQRPLPNSRVRAAQYRQRDSDNNDNTATSEHEESNTNQSAAKIGEMVIKNIERTIPQILASELNHFYLNMASKTDRSLGQFQRDLVMRLRRIEATSKKSLSEIQDGRQDTSHLSHLQRVMLEKVSSLKLTAESDSTTSNCEELTIDLNETISKGMENISTAVVNEIKIILNNPLPSTKGSHPRLHREKGGIAQPSLTSSIWNGVFSSRTSKSARNSVPKCGTPKQCLDSTASATLDEVKKLFQSLLSKGEELRRSLTKQSSEGVDLLKSLHQRFSVLLRRINTDPGHGDALLAEVQELEHLVTNSYSSILLAQNIFIESCQRVQQEQPTIERQIIEILNKLVTNIDLGHQFNRRQLQEVRELISQAKIEEKLQNITLIHPLVMNETNSNIIQDSHCESIFTLNEEIFDNLTVSIYETNHTKEKFEAVFERISSVETQLQSFDYNSGNLKDIIDEMLTGLKDLKGYSMIQVESLQSVYHNLFEIIIRFDLSKKIIKTADKNKASIQEMQNKQLYSKFGTNHGAIVRNNNPENEIHNICLSLILPNINVSYLREQFNQSVWDPDLNEKVKAGVSELIKNSNSKLTNTTAHQAISSRTSTKEYNHDAFYQNDDLYYDFESDDFLDDDNDAWNIFNYISDDIQDFVNVQSKSATPQVTYHSLKAGNTNKVTLLEEEFSKN